MQCDSVAETHGVSATGTHCVPATETRGTSLYTESRYVSDGDSHLGWGPYKSSGFDEKYSTVLV